MLIKQSPITINQDFFFYNHIFSSEMVIYHYPSNTWITIFWTATRYVLRDGCLRNENLLAVLVNVK